MRNPSVKCVKFEGTDGRVIIPPKYSFPSSPFRITQISRLVCEVPGKVEEIDARAVDAVLVNKVRGNPA